MGCFPTTGQKNWSNSNSGQSSHWQPIIGETGRLKISTTPDADEVSGNDTENHGDDVDGYPILSGVSPRISSKMASLTCSNSYRSSISAAFSSHLHQVTPAGLYIGDLVCMLSCDWINEGIKAIVSVMSVKTPEIQEVWALHPEIPHLFYILDDNIQYDDPRYHKSSTLFAEPPMDNVINVVDFIHTHLSNGTKVMVHCEQGKQRSAAVACAYLIWYQNMSRKDAIQLVQQRRRGATIPGLWRTELDRLAEMKKDLLERARSTSLATEHPLSPRHNVLEIPSAASSSTSSVCSPSDASVQQMETLPISIDTKCQ